MSFTFTPVIMQINLGGHYFLQGWKLLFQRSLLPFILLPILINSLLMVSLIWLFVDQVVGRLEMLVPAWLEWLNVLLMPLMLILIAVAFYFTFTSLANFIAAPFNAYLSEKVEQQLCLERCVESSTTQLLNDLPRMLQREWVKIRYSLPRLLALFILSFVPLLGQTFIPLLTAIFGAWLLAIQYCDYPFDNHKVDFSHMRTALSRQRMMTLTFGSLVSLCTFIPLVNLFVMPAAVCGATAMWVNEYRTVFKYSSDYQPNA